MKRLCILLIASAAAACGSQKTAPPGMPGPGTTSATVAKSLRPGWVDGAMPAPYDEATHLMVVGQGATEADADADARAKMQAAVLGPEPERPFVTVPDDLQNFAYAPGTERFTGPDGTVFVRLISQRVFIVDRLKQWAALLGRDALPDDPVDAFRSGGMAVVDASTHMQALAATLGFYRASNFVCSRRSAVSTSTCSETLDVAVLDRAVTEFGQAIRLQPKWDGGIPYRAGLGSQADVTVQAQWVPRSLPPIDLGELPVAFKRADEEAKVTTDDQGFARWAPTDIDPETRLLVRIDAETLLGSNANLWAKLPVLEIGVRAIDAKTARIGLAVDESAAGAHAQTGMAAQLTSAGMGRPQPLPAGLRSMLPAKPTAEQLRKLADAANGKFDLVVVGDLHSQFKSKLGRRTIWHEARGTLIIYDVWSGATLGPLKGQEKAKGLGETQASENALEALGAKLGQSLTQLITEHYRAAGASASAR